EHHELLELLGGVVVAPAVVRRLAVLLNRLGVGARLLDVVRQSARVAAPQRVVDLRGGAVGEVDDALPQRGPSYGAARVVAGLVAGDLGERPEQAGQAERLAALVEGGDDPLGCVPAPGADLTRAATLAHRLAD